MPAGIGIRKDSQKQEMKGWSFWLLGKIDSFSCIVKDQLTLFLCEQLPLVVQKPLVAVLHQGGRYIGAPVLAERPAEVLGILIP